MNTGLTVIVVYVVKCSIFRICRLFETSEKGRLRIYTLLIIGYFTANNVGSLCICGALNTLGTHPKICYNYYPCNLVMVIIVS